MALPRWAHRNDGSRRIAAVADRNLERRKWARKRTYREGAEFRPERSSIEASAQASECDGFRRGSKA